MPHRELHLEHQPGLWTWPMGLTMLRLVLLPVFLYLLIVSSGDSNRRSALAIFAVMAATDKLDGYLARKLNQTSKLGALLDPLADKLLIACSVVVLSVPRIAPVGFRIPVWLVVIIYGKDLLVAVGVLVLLSKAGKVSIAPRLLGKLGTFLQLSLVILVLLAPDLAKLDAATTRFVFITLIWCTAVMTIASGVDYILFGMKRLQESKRKGDLATDGAQMNTD